MLVILGITVGIAAGTFILYMKFGRKKQQVEAKTVDCIKYWDLFDYYKSSAIQTKLSENPHLKLYVQKDEKTVQGKKMYFITMAFFDSEKQDSVPLDKPFCLASEKMDDMLIEKLNGRTIMYMRDPIL